MGFYSSKEENLAIRRTQFPTGPHYDNELNNTLEAALSTIVYFKKSHDPNDFLTTQVMIVWRRYIAVPRLVTKQASGLVPLS